MKLAIVQGIFIVFLTANVLGFQCPKAVGNFPHEVKCDQYFTCFTYLPLLRGCHQGQIFDKNLKKCVPARGNKCFQASKKDGLMISGIQGKGAPTVQSSCSPITTETETFQPTVYTTMYTTTTNTIVRITEFETQTTTVHIAAITTTIIAPTSTVYP